ncbi:hypothetical protein EVA_21003 [gut metagenome]|uniref:Uncharacterized protein n=1 Tax=gut metagenome TaxID=749906 RepID=J9FU35_9ZZZZ
MNWQVFLKSGPPLPFQKAWSREATRRIYQFWDMIPENITPEDPLLKP